MASAPCHPRVACFPQPGIEQYAPPGPAEGVGGREDLGEAMDEQLLAEKLMDESRLDESRRLVGRLRSRRDYFYAYGSEKQFAKTDKAMRKAQVRHTRRANALYDPLLAEM